MDQLSLAAPSRALIQAEEVYNQFRKDIIAARISPDAKLRMPELCKRFDVSVGAVREALSRLSAEGFVVATPQKGFRVAPVSVEDLRELTNARAAIELLCLDMALKSGDLQWEADVLASHHRLRNTPVFDPDAPDHITDEWGAQHSDFHHNLVKGCNNKWLIRTHSMLHEQCERYRRLASPVFANYIESISAEHDALCDAVIARDHERVQQLVSQHILETAAKIIDCFIESRGPFRSSPPSA